MNSAIYIFSKHNSMAPLSSFFPEILLAGKSLIEHAIHISQRLNCEKLYFFGLNKEDLKSKDILNIKNPEIFFLESIKELESLIETNLFILKGEVAFSNELLTLISKTIANQKNHSIIWGFEENQNTAIFQPNYVDKTKDGSFTLRKSNIVELNHVKPIFSLCYLQKAHSSNYLKKIVQNLLEHKGTTILENYDNFLVLKSLKRSEMEYISFPWQILNANELLMKELNPEIKGIIEEGVKIHGKVTIESGAEILQGVYIKGPVFISKNAKIGPNCYLRAYTVIGPNVHIGQSVEIKNSIIMNNTNIGHLSYIGDSVIGPENNFGAGSKTANLAFHDKEIKSVINGQRISTGRRKLGIITGEKVKTGINSSLMPGIKLFTKAIVGANVLLQHDLLEQMMKIYSRNNELILKRHKFY